MNKARAALSTIVALAGVGIGLPGEASGPRSECTRCSQRGKHSALIRSVTGARYCHRCGFFESRSKP